MIERRYPGLCVAAILDAAGHWGNGQESANWVRLALNQRWKSYTDLTPQQAAIDLYELAQAIPADLRDQDNFGCDFDVAIVAKRGRLCHLVMAGAITATLFTPVAQQVVFSPRTWVAEQIELGHLTPEEASVHPLRGVITGPFAGPGSPPPVIIGPLQLPQPSVLILVERSLLELVQEWPFPRLWNLSGTAFQDHAAASKRFRGPVIMARTKAA